MRNPVDAFLLARLQAKGLHLSAEADRRTLARRLFIDLVGLPPAPEDVEAFVRDPDPLAYEKLVDRLLASPHYGERWARHWLDVVRYGESDGFERNTPRPNSWHYRDWVLRALNADLPYDEFCRLQLAGDVLAPGNADAVRATGFLVAGVHNTVVGGSAEMQELARQDELEDLVGAVGQTFLGLTVNCGRCHDHKFDPVSQKDFYRLAAALAGVQHGEHDLPGVAVKAYAALQRTPPRTRLFVRGQVTDPGEVVAPGGVAALGGADLGLAADAPEGQRRRRLAAWLTRPDNPLFARVMVNRLWHYHFGTGIVETPNDFGFNGGRPSHPELLDWLAAEFVARGFRLKEMHRLLVTSAAYRQASAPHTAGLAADADNRLLWRKKPLRLEGEVLRDAMLATAGLLNREVGGKGFSDYRENPNNGTTYYEPFDPAGPAFHRRSLYRFTPRGGNQGLLDSFDCPDTAAAAPRRSVTTTPLQALALWNNAFALRLSDALAARAVREEPGQGDEILDRRVVRVYRLAFQRQPRPEERASARRLAAEHGLAALCRALFNANEFLMVE